MTGVEGSFSRTLSPPCFCASANAWSESILRKATSKTCVEALFGLYASSLPGDTPREGASGALLPDHMNGFTPCCKAEAKLARQIADLPSCPLPSVDGVDSIRKGLTSAA